MFLCETDDQFVSLQNPLTKPCLVMETDCAVAMCPGGYHIVALDFQGSVWRSGANHHSQLDNLERGLTKVLSLPPIVSVAAACFRSYFFDEAGSVWVCGDNPFFQFGIETQRGEITIPTRIPNLQNIDKVFTGSDYTFFQDKEGWLWGCGAVFPLQDEAQEKKLVRNPMKMKKPMPGLKGIAINDTHCLYVDGNGAVWILKSNRNLDEHFFDNFVLTHNFPKVEMLSFSPSHILFLDENQAVYALGDNSLGRCGFPFNVYELTTPTLLENLPPIKQIQTGASHSVLLDVEGCVWTFGGKGEGQLGRKKEDTSPNHVPTKIEYLPKIVKIMCGAFSSMAVDEEGIVYACGFPTRILEFTILQGFPHLLELERKNMKTKSANKLC